MEQGFFSVCVCVLKVNIYTLQLAEFYAVEAKKRRWGLEEGCWWRDVDDEEEGKEQVVAAKGGKR